MKHVCIVEGPDFFFENVWGHKVEAIDNNKQVSKGWRLPK